MSRREQFLSVIGVVVIIAVGFFYFIYKPRHDMYLQLTEQLKGFQAQIDRMEATARQAEQLEREYRELQAFIASVESKLPSQKEVPTLLVQLERLTKSLRINLQSIRPSPLEAVSASTPPAGPGGAPAATPGTAPAPPAGGGRPPAQPAAAYFRFPIKLTMSADYSQLVRLMSELYDFPRLIRVKKLTMTPKQVPELNSELDVDTYVLPKGGG